MRTLIACHSVKIPILLLLFFLSIGCKLQSKPKLFFSPKDFDYSKIDTLSQKLKDPAVHEKVIRFIARLKTNLLREKVLSSFLEKGLTTKPTTGLLIEAFSCGSVRGDQYAATFLVGGDEQLSIYQCKNSWEWLEEQQQHKKGWKVEGPILFSKGSKEFSQIEMLTRQLLLYGTYAPVVDSIPESSHFPFYFVSIIGWDSSSLVQFAIGRPHHFQEPEILDEELASQGYKDFRIRTDVASIALFHFFEIASLDFF